jgi:hypothetical protein
MLERILDQIDGEGRCDHGCDRVLQERVIEALQERIQVCKELFCVLNECDDRLSSLHTSRLRSRSSSFRPRSVTYELHINLSHLATAGT